MLIPNRKPPGARRVLATVAAVAGVGAVASLHAVTTGTTLVSAAAPSSSVVAAEPVVSKQVAAKTVGVPAFAPATTTQQVPARKAKAVARTSKSPARVAAAPAMTTPSADACAGLQSTVDAFLQHVYAAHLETSPGQQVADALSVDQYVKTHTVMLENMLKPLLGGTSSTLDAFLQHVYAAHLETSPGQQVVDALSIDQYVKTHTVMAENMVKPLVGADLSSC